ncbi:hypothetical protein PQX77_014081 [Marasmius sp. AFHP31]|nr:hypothetical protein PQX77_014081 [Marasmius sp. AFHP31]
MACSERPTWIVHDGKASQIAVAPADTDKPTLELANGTEVSNQVLAERNGIAWHYLWYTLTASFNALIDDKTLVIPVVYEWGFWMFNVRTHVWQYDIPSISLSPSLSPSPSPPNTDLSLEPLCYPTTPLRQETPPQLDPTEIVACIENQFGDFLHVIASLGLIRHVEDLSSFARHGHLTFGAVVDRNNPKILAHLPTSASPQWYFQNRGTGVEAAYSSSVPWRVDICSDELAMNVDFHFSLNFPVQLQAYLAQCLPFVDSCYGPLNNLVFITEIRCSLVGTIYKSHTSSMPVYLFVPPIPMMCSNGVYFVHYPLTDPLFYWSFDPNGEHAISEEDWETNGIPRLGVRFWIGSSWDFVDYFAINQLLQERNYHQNGRQYAWERGYPALIPGDSFKARVRNSEHPDSEVLTEDFQSI